MNETITVRCKGSVITIDADVAERLGLRPQQDIDEATFWKVMGENLSTVIAKYRAKIAIQKAMRRPAS